MSSACPVICLTETEKKQELRCAGFDCGWITVETTRETLPDSTAGPASLHARLLDSAAPGHDTSSNRAICPSIFALVGLLNCCRVRWSPALHPQRPLGPLRLSGVALRVHLWCPRVRRGPSSAKR